MNLTVFDLFAQIKELYTKQSLDEFHQRFRGDDEFKKISKQTKIQKSQLDSLEDKTALITKLKKIINESKTAHKEALFSAKKFEIATQDKEKGNCNNLNQVLNENSKLKNQIKTLETFRNTQTNQLNEYQEKYSKVVDEEKQKKTELVEGFQQEIKDISTKMEEVSNAKHKSQAENEALKEKMKEIQEHVEKRDKIFDEELNKLDSQRKERETKIFEQINNISQSLGTSDGSEEQLQKIKEEEALVEAHLNPHLQKAEEFQQIIEKTNQQFNLYKGETEKLAQSCRTFEQKSQACQRKCEKSDIYIVEQAKEHLTLQTQLKQKQEQVNSLLTLKQTLQSGLI
ncbi:unnamed protein product (macronuclear) [Paramecium tetraurelia]|uniref:Viral A-type inclusion protein n=1 Tax=Paramecium tetraurelia TaxID=5888 RepID=A0DHD9_PARTE|nr:uncharacterized protein GSPATT00016843001 [Paramecium tetraurelia]CAK82456.1 unnamed protein product [Paramecium tetraurelia]|eukprot:XP_001449853.1 hypothetical protein (macronuclear) [Paramecium tetraurelia strain d4-2]